MLRGHEPSNFAAFRCGSVRDRFSQIDMLHVDIWWRGHNVLVDGGSYLYNGPALWHEHFMGTASHNTVVVDGRDQMLLFRRFKTLYWTRAALLGFEDTRDRAVVTGEHYGYERHPGACVHRRSVLFVKDDLWVVVDRITGAGRHRARLHWLGGNFPYTGDPSAGGLTLVTPHGEFSVRVYDVATGRPAFSSIVSGQATPARGWLSRHFGEKVQVPSLVTERDGDCPLTLLTVLGAGTPTLEAGEGEGRWQIGGTPVPVSFRLEDGFIADVQ
jgi:asparagine synthase (glutamine-hydrolysing)